MKTKIFNLGGMQEIGKSCFVVEHDDEIIVLDAGIKFPESFLLGVSGMIPNYSYLIENKHKVKALFITHAHEDHIGGIPYLLKQVHIPKLYMPRIGIEYLKNKLKEHRFKIESELIEIEESLVFAGKHITVDFYVTTHSIPDAFSIRVRTVNGTFIDTGDFRFDYTPIGQIANFERIKQFGAEGVDLLVSDATNAMIPHHSPTEQIILKDIARFLQEGKGKTIVTIFASNVTRIKAIIELARRIDKKIVLLGKSIVNGMKIAFRLNYIDAKNSIIVDAKNISKYQESEILVICTGSQGEENAALNRISQGLNKSIKIKKGDVVIFSSSAIPGNRIKVEELVNRLSVLGANVKEHNVDGIIHTSGHAYHDEHMKILTDLKPKYFVPYHGEYRMSIAHINTAIEAGVDPKNTWTVANGEVMYLENHVLTQSDERIDARPVYVDGLSIKGVNNQIMDEREQLANSGFVSIVVVINRAEKNIVGRLKIVSKGTVYVKQSQELIYEAQSLVHRSILYTIKNFENWTVDSLKQLIEKKLQPFFHKARRRNPLVISSLFVV